MTTFENKNALVVADINEALKGMTIKQGAGAIFVPDAKPLALGHIPFSSLTTVNPGTPEQYSYIIAPDDIEALKGQRVYYKGDEVCQADTALHYYMCKASRDNKEYNITKGKPRVQLYVA